MKVLFSLSVCTSIDRNWFAQEKKSAICSMIWHSSISSIKIVYTLLAEIVAFYIWLFIIKV